MPDSLNERVDVFFYGLFMDPEVLRAEGVEAENPRRGHVEGFALKIGRRAALVPEPGARAYGMVYSLTRKELERLYSGPGLEAYVPETVMVHLSDGGTVMALCYNLKSPPSQEDMDTDYASRLSETLQRLGF